MRLKLIFTLLALICGGCQSNSPASNAAPDQANLTVSAAVSLKDAFTEIGALYKSKNGAAIDFNFGASGALQKQIESGAPVDVFASAGEKQMDELAAKNLIDAATRRDFVGNELVLIVAQNPKSNIETFFDLTKPDVQKIAVGNPKTVPAGQYADQLFDKTNIKNAVRSKLIFAEDVRQALDYVARGETDAGIVYRSDAQIAGDKVRIAATAPDASHDAIFYPIAIVKDGGQKRAAQQFIDLVLSAEGQNILRKYGFAGAAEK